MKKITCDRCGAEMVGQKTVRLTNPNNRLDEWHDLCPDCVREFNNEWRDQQMKHDEHMYNWVGYRLR